MAGLVPAIYVLPLGTKTWMPGIKFYTRAGQRPDPGGRA